ncbi:MAG: ATP-binding cassette domain-containing protein, partial [Thermoleophilaceae bacterium]|nr:ATP-binding cassette domain-containing protein [Thermoleophilaceae bacterium]
MVLAERFSYAYPELDRPALGEITLEIEAGSFVLLAGESGSGKSSLLRAVAGLVPHFHGGSARGELRVDGMSIRDCGPGELAGVCGSVFQDPETQIVMSGVRAEIGLALEHRGEPPEVVARAVEEIALALGIEGLLDRRTETLSGGELQRVALAGALAHRPRLLLLDEPTAQLDPVAGDELIWLLRRLNEEWGTTVLLAEHRLERCLGAADRVVALEGGRIVCDGQPADFLRWAVDGARESFATPLARMFALAGADSLPTSVKQARAALGPVPDEARPARIEAGAARGRRTRRRQRSEGAPAAALSVRGLWCELGEGPVVLRSIDLELAPGERVALMGRNGAGKSTLLRHVNGLVSPTRGTVEANGRVALLVQNPGDYLVRERA